MHTNPDITTDLFLGGKLKIQQYKKGYRSGSDSVFLAAFIPNIEGKILEVGCGTGVATLCTAYRLKKTHVTGIDIDDQAIRLANLSAQQNNLQNRCTFLSEDIRSISLPKQSFDYVFSNPPYFNSSSPSLLPQRALSRNQYFPLSKWVEQCIKMAKPRGRVIFVYPTADLSSLLCALKNLGDIQLFPLWPKKGAQSKRILISARKGVKTGFKLHPGLILHGTNGSYSPQAQSILRKGKGINFS